MRRARFAVLVLPLLFLACPVAQAGDKAADKPAIVVRVNSINALLQNLNLVVRLVGQEDVAQQIEGLVKSKIGKQGLEGVDPARPIGAYVRFGKALDEVNGALLIPIVDEKAFLNLLDNLSVVYAKGKDGIYTHKTNKNVDVYFRFANKYLYITSVNPEAIRDKNLPDPAKALAVQSNATIAVVARFDQIPNDAKLIALTQLEGAIRAAEKKAPPGETKVQQAFRVALLNDLGKLAAGVIKEAGEVRFDLDVSDKTKELTVNFSVTGTPGSDLAKTIKGLGELKSPLAGILKNDLAFQGAFHLALPDDLNRAFGKAIDEVAAQSLAGIQDAQKKKQALALIQALLPTARSGEFQLVYAALGPKQDRYTLVSALKLKDGDKLGKTVHDLIQDALTDLPPAERARIQLNFARVGAIQIHKFQVEADAPTRDLLNQLVGDDHLYVAFRDDAVFLTLGQEGLPTMRSVLARTDSVASVPFLFDFDLARIAKVAAKTPEQKALAAKLFPDGTTGRVRMSIEGGKSLNARLQMQLNVLEFVVKSQEK